MKIPLSRQRRRNDYIRAAALSAGTYYRNFEDSIKSPAILRSYRYVLQDYMKYRKISDISSLLEGDCQITRVRINSISCI